VPVGASWIDLGIWLSRRVAAAVFVIWAVCTVTFVVTYVVTDPAAVALPLDATEEQRQQLRHILGLDRPIGEQYFDFVRGLVTPDFGDSFWQQRPALEIVLERLPRTLFLTLGAIMLVLVVSPFMALYVSQRPRGIADRLAGGASLMALSAPPFWVAYILILVFAVQLGWLPTYGSTDPTGFVLPMVVLGLPAMGRVLLQMRSEARGQLHEPYMLVAEARGFSESHLRRHYTARNVGVALATFVGWEVTRMIAGYSVVVETVFGWPGIGELTVQAAEHQDLILLQACLVVTAVLIVFINIGLDLVRSRIDPRIGFA
jgi:peptide/nickel transport system permease protein